MTSLPNLNTLIDEIKCIYTQLDDRNKDDLIGNLIVTKDHFIKRFELKARAAQEQLVNYKCVLVEDLYIVVPLRQEGHRIGNINKDVLFYNHPVKGHNNMQVYLREVPYGPSELLAWIAAFNKLCNKV